MTNDDDDDGGGHTLYRHNLLSPGHPHTLTGAAHLTRGTPSDAHQHQLGSSPFKLSISYLWIPVQ